MKKYEFVSKKDTSQVLGDENGNRISFNSFNEALQFADANGLTPDEFVIGEYNPSERQQKLASELNKSMEESVTKARKQAFESEHPWLSKFSSTFAPESYEETMATGETGPTITNVREAAPVVASSLAGGGLAPLASVPVSIGGRLAAGAGIGMTTKGVEDIAKTLTGDKPSEDENFLKDYLIAGGLGAGAEGLANIGSAASRKLISSMEKTGQFPNQGFGSSTSWSAEQAFRKPFPRIGSAFNHLIHGKPYSSEQPSVINWMEKKLNLLKNNLDRELSNKDFEFRMSLDNGGDTKKLLEEYKVMKESAKNQLKAAESEIERAKVDDNFALSKVKEMQAENIEGPVGTEAVRIGGRTLPTIKSLMKAGASEHDINLLRGLKESILAQGDELAKIKKPSLVEITPTAGLKFNTPGLSLKDYYQLSKLGHLGNIIVPKGASSMSNYVVPTAADAIKNYYGE